MRDSVQRCNGNIDNDDEDDDDVDDDDTIEDHLDVDDDGDEDGAVDKEEEREAVVQSEVIKRFLKLLSAKSFGNFSWAGFFVPTGVGYNARRCST